MALHEIKTIILLMFENRSFDNMLGHLSFENLQPAVNGLRPPLDQDQYANLFKGGLYPPFVRPTDEQLQGDLPHEYNFVATQLAVANGAPQMTGFVQAYADSTGAEPNRQCDPLCFYGSGAVPVTSFLARAFCTCDSWHCPLPTSTQPNRTVAFCGHSEIYQTKLQAIPATDNIFSWLDKNHISWGVYHDGFTFFALYPDLWATAIFSGKFRDYERLATDLKNGTQPQVIIVEPSYQDAPHIGPDHPNDNHPPLAVGWGEDLLRRTYQAATINPAVWASTLMVVYYDEHGGFYDHVSPPAFDNAAAGNALPPPDGGPVYGFGSLGPRVPAILISPWVAPASVNHNLYDHTSVLQLLAELYTPGIPYSAAVASRASQGIKSLSTALAAAATTTAPPAPPADPIFAKSLLGDNIATPPDNDMGRSLEDAALQMIAKAPAQVDTYFPLLNNWKAAVVQARPETIPPLTPQIPPL
jgi:phospholipase C